MCFWCARTLEDRPHKNSLPNNDTFTMWEKQHKKPSATVCAPSELYSLIVLWLLNNNNMSSLSPKRLRHDSKDADTVTCCIALFLENLDLRFKE